MKKKKEKASEILKEIVTRKLFQHTPLNILASITLFIIFY